METKATQTSESPRTNYPLEYGWLYTATEIVQPVLPDPIPVDGLPISFGTFERNSNKFSQSDKESITLAPNALYEIYAINYIAPTAVGQLSIVYKLYNETAEEFIGGSGSCHQDRASGVYPNVQGATPARAFIMPTTKTTISLRYITLPAVYDTANVAFTQYPGSALLVKTYANAKRRDS